jgi:hypothetical protein
MRMDGRVRVRADDLPDQHLVMTAQYPGPEEGALASAAGLIATAAFFWSVSRGRP